MRLPRRSSPARALLLTLALTVLPIAAPPALVGPAAAAQPARAQDGVRVGRVALAPLPHGRASLLVSVSYPLAMAGRRVELHVSVARRGGGAIPVAARPVRLSAGFPRRADRRRRFSFVHQVVVDAAQARELRRSRRVMVTARARLDANHDGRPELSASASAVRTLARGAGAPACGTVPQLFAHARYRVSVKLPACAAARRWRVAVPPAHGKARIHGIWLTYTPAKSFRGTDTLKLAARSLGGGPQAATVTAPVVIRVQNSAHFVVRAMGDSVTAGFGYYSDGKTMSLFELPECRPGSVTLVDACSSNSTNTSNSAKKVEFAPDYGLSNNISWAAQWANEYGVTDYENLAISGSEPGQWAPGGPLYPLTKRIEAEDPDYVLLTIGANPLLSEMLFGVDHMGCAIFADVFGDYRRCIEQAFAKIGLHDNLERLYRELVQKTSATIYLMQYHLSIPSSALAYSSVQIAEMAAMMNAEIAAVAAAVNPKRLQVVAPPHFNVGVDLEPVYPSTYSCSRFGYKVDGPSVQSRPTQDELLVTHPLSFCQGPVHGPPWVISGDTGIHPSATGYAQMASQVPPPK